MENDIEKLYQIYLQHPKVTTDSRNITNDCLFFALKGENFDGNAFAPQAISQGASYAVIDNPAYESRQTILVDDSLRTLQDLASLHRSKWKIPVIGITGTNGKTTTKELLNAVLKMHFSVHATQGNFNNHIGVPLTILSAPTDTEIAIIEMGANHPGEIASLCEIACPTHGLITNIGKAHLEGFGGYEGVINAKNELYHYLKVHGGILFVNGNNDLLMRLSDGMNRILYGSGENFLANGNISASDPYLDLTWSGAEEIKISTRLVGGYNFENVMAAIAVGQFFKVPVVKIIEAIENYVPSNNRSQTLKTENNLIILDAYNANPSSMQAALENFEKLKAGPKIVILGDMLELGTESRLEHEKIITLLEQLKFQRIILVGPEFKQVAGTYPVFTDSIAARDWLKDEHLRDYTILVKGSRGIRMEKVLEAL